MTRAKKSASFDDAVKLIEAEQYADALPVLERVIAADPKHAQAWLKKGTVHRKLGDSKQALACYQTSAKLEPASALVHWCVGREYADHEEVAKAVKAYDAALEVDPTYFFALRDKAAALLFELAQPAQAYALYGQFEKKTAADWNNCAVACLRTQHFEQALEALDHSLALKPDDERAWLRRGSALTSLKRWADAEASFAKVKTNWKKWVDSSALWERGTVARQLGHPKNARAMLELANDLRGGDGALTGELIEVLLELGDLEAARAVYAKYEPSLGGEPEFDRMKRRLRPTAKSAEP